MVALGLVIDMKGSHGITQFDAIPSNTVPIGINIDAVHSSILRPIFQYLQ